MKLDQFMALCEREWTQEFRGDVQALHLTADSHRELNTDVLVKGYSPGHLLYIDREELPAIRAGAAISIIVNPITRSEVKITGGADSDTAEVYSVPESRTVALA